MREFNNKILFMQEILLLNQTNLQIVFQTISSNHYQNRSIIHMKAGFIHIRQLSQLFEQAAAYCTTNFSLLIYSYKFVIESILLKVFNFAIDINDPLAS